jgi:hypothetical protein
MFSAGAALATLEVELHAHQRQREIAAISRRNTELRIAHFKEVKARKIAQRQYERDLDAYEENKENLQRQYKDAVRLAEIEYEQVKAYLIYCLDVARVCFSGCSWQYWTADIVCGGAFWPADGEQRQSAARPQMRAGTRPMGD